MLYCIVGETARGKDTLVRYIKQTYGLQEVCSYATREMRPNETQDVEHHFISKIESQIILSAKQEDVVAYTKIGDVEYFALKDDLKDADLYIIDPAGVKYLKQKCKDMELCIIYITCSDENAKMRAKKRGDKAETLKKRMEAEKEQFSSFVKDGLYDYRYDNNGELADLYAFADKVIQERRKP